MGHEVQYLSETKRLVSLVAVVFAVFMMFQYFEFPYGDVVSSLFSASRAQEVVNGTYPTEALSQIPQIHGNITHSYALDSSNSSLDALSTIPATLSPLSSPAPSTLPITVDTTLTGTSIVLDPDTSKPEKDVSKSVQDSEESQKSPVLLDDKSANEVHPMGEVVTISEMHDMLAHNRASSRSMEKPNSLSMLLHSHIGPNLLKLKSGSRLQKLIT
ncbi:exostosin-like protein [Artemisia annua]|uniref:Exostosin-like protein n=1 Tax=Artemisia annua TaxID=35608 RepID=A0A2U1N5N8_ARTAN|nr:exostosin-like protein [Artemisia annua]